MAGILLGGAFRDRIGEAHFRISRRWLIPVVGATFLVHAVRIALA
jgi:hypothetical protein